MYRKKLFKEKRMKKPGFGFVLVFGFFTVILGITGCEKDSVISQERAVNGFNGIGLAGIGNVNVYPGANYRVVVTTDSNLQDRVLTTVNGNTLNITQRPGPFNAEELKIDVYLPELTNISLNGAGNFTINNGSASALTLSISGAGNINAQNYQVQNVFIAHSGIGDVRVWATNSLNGTLSGIGNIRYRGNPTININKTGLGNINPL